MANVDQDARLDLVFAVCLLILSELFTRSRDLPAGKTVQYSEIKCVNMNSCMSCYKFSLYCISARDSRTIGQPWVWSALQLFPHLVVRNPLIYLYLLASATLMCGNTELCENGNTAPR